jgi:DNA invertase Pin-like site-specific DNA recombinase
VTAKVFIDTFGVFAEFEANPRRERRLEGDHAAKAGGESGRLTPARCSLW